MEGGILGRDQGCHQSVGVAHLAKQLPKSVIEQQLHTSLIGQLMIDGQQRAAATV